MAEEAETPDHAASFAAPPGPGGLPLAFSIRATKPATG